MRTMTPLHKRSSLNALLCALVVTQASLSAAEKSVASFENEESLKTWTSVNDGVMGGVSKGGFIRSDQGTLLFRGELSLKNNGGFASIRMKQTELDLSSTNTLVVKAKGDGRTYWIDLRAKDQMAASSYRAYMPTTAGEWKEVRVPLAEFKLQAFGRELPFKPIDPASVASVGFTLADKKEGAFELEIASIKAAAQEATDVQTGSGKTIVDVAQAAGGFKTLLAAATAAELASVLSGDGPFTVFAPTDEAFAKLPVGTVDTLLKPENRAQLVDILKYHVIAGKVSLAKALDLREGSTLQGSKVDIRFEDGRVKVGAAALIKANISASNGIIHVIDQVLIPAKTLAEPLSPSDLIELAIKKGVPLFNSGEVAGCAALYELTCEALRSMDGLPEEFRQGLTNSLKEARAEESTRQRAWILRGAIDRAWTTLNVEQ
jgi:uncharacterized surface protein with fasciclin (FAS1) repeats